MTKIAFIFPGQGSQSTGMGLDLCNNFEAAKNVYNYIDKESERKYEKISTLFQTV